MKVSRTTLTAVAVLIGITGCGGGSSSANGRLSIGITDAPVDNQGAEVMLKVSGLEIQGPDGRIDVEFTPEKNILISSLVNGASTELLTDYELPPGHYEWIRLKVQTETDNDTYIRLGETSYELTIPSSAQTGLKMVRGFDVAADGSTDFTIDFDLRKSIVLDANGYKLKPVLRIVDNIEVGSIIGHVDLNTLCSGGSYVPAIYVYPGFGATAKDINNFEGTGPITSALLNDTGDYHAAFLAEGDYTVALACNAGLDEPESSQDIGFAAITYGVTVTANQTSRQTFQ